MLILVKSLYGQVAAGHIHFNSCKGDDVHLQGFGCMSLGAMASLPKPEDAVQVLKRSFDSGIYLLNSADGYGCEEVIGMGQQ